MQIRSLIVVFVLSALSVLGQTFGDITGQVADASHSAVAESMVTLTNTSTNATRQATSNAEGLYTFTAVPPRTYNIKVEHPGFKSATSKNGDVHVQQTVRLDFTLEVGQVTESLQVDATADLLQSENATVGSVIESKSIAELPLNGRECLNLVTLSPNVSN